MTEQSTDQYGAFMAGSAAAEQGQGFAANPYIHGSDMGRAWHSGWQYQVTVHCPKCCGWAVQGGSSSELRDCECVVDYWGES